MSCSVCQYTHQFTSIYAGAYVCPACYAILHKGVSYHDNRPQEAFRIEEDMSVFAIGSTITIEGVTYTLVGRFQHWFLQGFRNTWLLHAVGQPITFFIERPGTYAVCRTAGLSIRNSDLKGINPGNLLPVTGEWTERLRLETAMRNDFTRMEGEVVDVENQSSSFLCFDFTNSFGDWLHIRVFDKGKNAAYAGRLYQFSQLNAQHIKIGHEWD